MAKRPYTFTPARAQALARARAVSAAKRRAAAGHRINTREAKRTVRATENAGKQLQHKVTPYARINRHSQSVGFHGRANIPGTGRRLVAGGHIRIEKTSHSTVTDKFIPATSVRHGKINSSFGQHKVSRTIPKRKRR
jgi:hypothetical protein